MAVCIFHSKEKPSMLDTKTKEFKLFKIPVLSLSSKENGRVRVYIFGLKIFSYKKRNKFLYRPKVKPVVIPKDLPNPKGVIYTCITGGYDNLIQHNCINQNFDYVCFTDNKELIKQKQAGIWQIRPLVFDKLDATRNNRWHKTHPHILFPEYDLSIYLDSNIDVLSPKLFDSIKPDKKLQVPTHYARDCIYEEAKEAIKLRKESPANIEKMMGFLKKNHMPAHYGLNENNILIRQHKDKHVQKMMDEWWSFIENYTKRDQLSFSFVLWKNGVKVDDISFDNARFDYKNYYFEFHILEKKG